MNKEHTQYLFETYPKIFVDRDKSPRESLVCFGFEYADGWFDLTDRLCKKLQELSDQSGHQIVAVQMKEKFGGLRFYVDSATAEQHEAIRQAESESYRTCEYCGTTENVGHTGGWITTICKPCYDKSEPNGNNWTLRDSNEDNNEDDD